MAVTPDTPAGGEATAPHPTSIAVWDVPSPVVVNDRFTVQVGVKCSAGCPLAGRSVVVRNKTGGDVGQGRLGTVPAPGTRALYVADVTLDAPAGEGIHAWTVAFAAAGPGSAPAQDGVPADEQARALDPAPAHAGATAAFGFRTVGPPEHRATVTVFDRDTEAPLAGVEVRLGVHRGSTDARGQATVEAQAGSHELYVRKAGYVPHTADVTVSGDVALRIAAVRASDTDPEDERVWM